MSMCKGNRAEHCCWSGAVCAALEEDTVPGRRWACGLRRRLGSWDAVHVSPEYQSLPVAQFFRERFPGYGCGDYPQAIPAIMKSPTAGRCCYDRSS